MQFSGGSGVDQGEAVGITGVKGEMGGENVAGKAAIKAAKANWLAENYPGWAIVSELGGVDGSMVYNAVTIRKGATTKKVYFNISEYAWSVMPG